MAKINFSSTMVGVIITWLTLIVGASAAFAISQHQINRHELKIQQMQEEYRKDHDILLEIKRDVHWIRSNMPGDSPT